jgi:hypothetical protein
MALLRPDGPRTSTQRRFDRTAIITLCCLGIALGLYQAHACSKIAYGYAAGYSFGAALGLGVLIILGGLPFTIYWRTRWVGAGLLCAGLLSCAAFYGGIGLLVKLDRVAWKHEPPLTSFGPNEIASAVVYFCPNVTNGQVEGFSENVLQEDANPRHPGRDFPVFVASYLRLLPTEANGHDAVAITFRESASQEATARYLARIQSDPRVAKVFTDVAPTRIHLENPRSVDAICR